VLRLHLVDPFEEPGVETVPSVRDRGEHEPAHERRVRDGDLEGDAGPEAVPEEVRALDAELEQQRGDVLGELRDGQRAVDVGGTAVRL
jgi:hypothetical protein